MKLDDLKKYQKMVIDYNKMFDREINSESISLQHNIHNSELNEFEIENDEGRCIDAVCDSFVTLIGLRWMIDQAGTDLQKSMYELLESDYEDRMLEDYVVSNELHDQFINYLDAVIQSNLTKFSTDPSIIKKSKKIYPFKTKIMSKAFNNEIYHYLVSDTKNLPKYPYGKQLKPICYKHPSEFYDYYD